MIYEVTPTTPDVMQMLRDSLQFEKEREEAREVIQQEIRDRHDAALVLIEAQATAPNHATYELFRRSTRKLERYTDMLFGLLEVL